MFCFAELYNPSVFSESQENLVKHSLRQQLTINRYDSSIFIADMDKTRCIIAQRPLGYTGVVILQP